MKTRCWSVLLAALLVALLVTIPTGCSTQREPVAEKSAAQSVEQEEPVHTRNDPGAWEGKQSSHVPLIAYKKTGTGLSVTVTVNHVMDPSIPHFIEWIKLMDGEAKVLGEASFVATDKKAEATFEVPSVPAKLAAVERCNVHGLWKEEVPVT